MEPETTQSGKIAKHRISSKKSGEIIAGGDSEVVDPMLVHLLEKICPVIWGRFYGSWVTLRLGRALKVAILLSPIEVQNQLRKESGVIHFFFAF